MGKRLFALLLAVVFALAFGGCSLWGERNGGQPSGLPASSQGQGSGPEASEVKILDPSTGNKAFDSYSGIFDTYTFAYRLMTGRLQDSLELYHTCAGSQEAFLTPENVYTCHAISKDYMERVEALHGLADAGTGMDELDRAFETLYPSLITLINCLNDIEAYTDRKTYRTDDYAKGKEHHAVLWEAENRYEACRAAFEGEYLRLATERQMESVQYYQENGREMMSTVNLLMITAQTIQRELQNQEVEDETILDMDLDVIEPLCDTFIGYAAKVRELDRDREKLDAEGFPYDHPHWDLFLRYMSSTERSMTKVVQRVKDQNPIDETEVVVPFAGGPHLTAFDKGVSEMINAYTHMLG